MESDREAMRLVSDPLEEEEALGAPREHHGLLPPRQEDLLEALCQRGDGDPACQVGRLERSHRHGELPLAAIDDHEVGQRREAAVVLGVVLAVVLIASWFADMQKPAPAAAATTAPAPSTAVEATPAPAKTADTEALDGKVARPVVIRPTMAEFEALVGSPEPAELAAAV